MSLYDDLGVETSDSKTEGWSKNFKLLQSQLQVKKAALTQAKVKTSPEQESRGLQSGFLIRMTRNLVSACSFAFVLGKWC